MTYRTMLALLASLVLAPDATAWAQGFRAPYVAFGGFWFVPSDSDVSSPSVDLEASSESGIGAFVAVGTPAFDSGRVEIEAAWRHNDFDELTVSGFSMPLDGGITAVSLMANAYVDFSPGETTSPYLGIGAGTARLTLDSAEFGPDERSDTVFAYQAMAGLVGRVSDRLTLFGGYRYFATADPTFDEVESEYSGHNLEVGVRVDF